MEIVNNLARESAADFFAHILMQAYESITLEEIETGFEVDTATALAILFELGTANAAIYWDEDEDDELSEFQVGDPDPTFWGETDRGFCLEPGGNYRCTRWVNHPGGHIAGDGIEVCQVWE